MSTDGAVHEKHGTIRGKMTEKERPHILIIDDEPEMNGIEFVRALRKRLPQFPVVGMSGNPAGRQFLDVALR